MISKSLPENKEQKQKEKTYSYFFRSALLKGQEFYKYQTYKIPINKQGQQNYEIVSKIGRGKYSDVFKTINVNDDKYYVLKILKPVREQKIKRQIKILFQLDHPSIIKLYEVLFDQSSKCNCLVFDFVNVADYRDLIDIVKPNDVKKIIYQCLQGLLHCHEKGIMHRDIKPQNILIDQDTLQTKISDWGLAEYYLTDTQYNVRVASRHYKGPQLLLNNRSYDFSLDIWSLGLVFAGFLFRTYALFKGDDNPDQMKEIMKHFGSDQVKKYVQKYRLFPDTEVTKYINQSKQKARRSWSYYINTSNKELCDEMALDLLDKMLQIDHEQRINVIEALEHPYFKKIQGYK